MRLAQALGVVLVCAGSYALAEAQPEGDFDLSSVTAVVAAAEGHIAGLDQLIAAQEAKLDAIYDQRDAAAAAGQRDKAAQFGMVIDQLNLVLTNLEAERDGMAATVAVLKDQIAALGGTDQTAMEE